jgi:Carboxypeptidase regulatory-like domain/TonB dependent receptor
MRRIFLVVLLVLGLSVAANAQTFRGAINGTVTDPSGGVVPNAQVKATEIATGIDHVTVTTSEGQFAFQDIPLGQYRVTVTASGFPPHTVDKVDVSAGTIYTLNVKLTLQQQATTVEVSAAAITLDTTTATQNMTITSDIVQDVPLNGRDFTQLIAVAPGYGGYSVGGFGSMNGARANQNNWQIDGVDNNDFWHNIPAVNQGGVSGIAGVVLPIDSIDEFSSQTQSGAESGRNAGGTVNLVIKSGSNTLHGSAYYYNRNEFYSAASPFLPPGTKAPPLRNQNYGFSVGGPFVKNKLFYFTSFEKQQYIIGLSGVATEPSDAWIAQAMDILNNPGNKYGSYAPVAPSSLSQNLIGPSGFWPRNLIGGLAGTNNNFFSPVASTGYSYNGTAKVDYQITDKHHLYLRFFGGQGSQTAPLGGSPALGTASSNLKDYFEVAPLHVFNESAVLNSTFSSRLTNQILVGANYFNQIFHDFNNSFDTKNMGLFLSPGATDKGQPILGAPNVVIGNFEQIGLTPPEGRSDLTWHITDIVSYTMGAHQLRFGGEFRRGRVNEFYHRRGTGKFVFDGSQGDQTQCVTVSNQKDCAWGFADSTKVDSALCNSVCQGLDPNARALADYLAGSVSTSSIAVGNPERNVYVNAFNFYFQDSWQLNKKLSVNYGMRYEYFGPLHNGDKDVAVFTPDKGLVIQGAGIDSIFPADRNNFAPRLGFAYQARNDLVVRGSLGVYYDQININPFLDFRPPANAADGLQDNPIGPHPVSNYSLSGYNWQTVQAGGASIFPDVATCSTLNVVTQSSTDACGANIFAAYAVNQNFRTPYFFNYSLQVEKSLGNASVFQLGYVGSQGRKLNVMLNINPADTSGNRPFDAQYPNAGNILQENSIGTSNYNALQATYRLRTWHGLTTQLGYTWSHSLDEISQYRAVVADSPDIKVDYGNSDNDTRHLFTTSISYDVPNARWAHGWSTYLFNGWQVSSLWNFHTGQPWNITLPLFDLVADPFKSDAQYTVNHSFTRDIIQKGQSTGPGVQWVNPNAFGTATGAFGTLSRNKYYGPGYGSVDFSIFKNIPIRERLRIQLRAEMFNLFNRVNFASGPGAVNGDGTVRDTIGDFNGAPGIGPGEAFNMQLAAKIIF